MSARVGASAVGGLTCGHNGCVVVLSSSNSSRKGEFGPELLPTRARREAAAQAVLVAAMLVAAVPVVGGMSSAQPQARSSLAHPVAIVGRSLHRAACRRLLRLLLCSCCHQAPASGARRALDKRSCNRPGSKQAVRRRAREQHGVEG